MDTTAANFIELKIAITKTLDMNSTTVHLCVVVPFLAPTHVDESNLGGNYSKAKKTIRLDCK